MAKEGDSMNNSLEWRIKDRGDSVSFSIDEIKELIKSGEINRKTLLKHGASEWLPVEDFEHFQFKKSSVRPLIRFWARAVDGAIWSFFLTILFGYLSIGTTKTDQMILFNIATLFTWIFVESVLLSTIGTTFGKYLLGIVVRNAHGSKPTYLQSLKRSFMVWWRGQAIGLPFIIYVVNITAYQTLKHSGETSWDRELNFSVEHRPVRIIGTIIVITIFCSVFIYRFYLWRQRYHV
jgi:uncharacterized RDD family membrane protein YckC